MAKIKTQIQTFSYKVSDATKEEMIEYFKYKKRDFYCTSKRNQV